MENRPDSMIAKFLPITAMRPCQNIEMAEPASWSLQAVQKSTDRHTAPAGWRPGDTRQRTTILLYRCRIADDEDTRNIRQVHRCTDVHAPCPVSLFAEHLSQR